MNKILIRSRILIYSSLERFQLLKPKVEIFNQYLTVNFSYIKEFFVEKIITSKQNYASIPLLHPNNKESNQYIAQSQLNRNADHNIKNTQTHGLKDTTKILQANNDAKLTKDTFAKQLKSEIARLTKASWAFTTRRVPYDAAYSTVRSEYPPQAGDLVLARVDLIGHHAGLQLANGRRKVMFEGDEIVVAYGNRYASSQFEALIPKTMGPCHLVAGGGVASRAISWHNRIIKGPTHISPIGFLVNSAGKRINLHDFAIPAKNQITAPVPVTLAVVGTSMDSGKTQTAAYFAKGLIAAGLNVGYAKITGTGAGGDTWLLKDAGATPVLDFTDAGMATTYMASAEEIECILMTLVNQIAQDGVDAIILEIADGVFQRETASLLQSSVFKQTVSGIIVAARDSMGAYAGVDWLKSQTTKVLALSGVISSAPLQAKEARLALNLPVYNREELSTSIIAMNLIDQSHLDIEKGSFYLHKQEQGIH